MIRTSSKIFLIFLLIFWPGVVGFSECISAEGLNSLLNENLPLPPFLSLINGHWILSEPLWKKIYINAWFINSLVISMCYLAWLIKSPQQLTKMRDELTTSKAFAFGCLVTAASLAIYSGLGFHVERELSSKTKFLLFDLYGVTLLFPMVMIGAWRKLFLNSN
jgi:hypothetical protein